LFIIVYTTVRFSSQLKNADQDIDTIAHDNRQSSPGEATAQQDSGVSDMSMEDDETTEITRSVAGKSYLSVQT
jgi:hypothetical protein